MTFFDYLEIIDDFYWGYIGFALVVLSGLYFSIRSRLFQLQSLCQMKKSILNVCTSSSQVGVHPLKLYFASIGGMIGLGNIVGAVTSLTIGGPGALFWLWIASLSGMLIKYSEIFLGVKYRVPAGTGYDGGPMYYLKHAFKTNLIPLIVSMLLCIYGVEVFQFVVVADTLVDAFDWNRSWVIGGLLVAIFTTSLGGIRRLADFCTVLMPIFMVLYIFMCLWVVVVYFQELPSVLSLVLKSAFTGHAAVGGFAGASFLIAAQQGISRAVYSGDIGIGYDSIIQSETNAQHPERQAKLSIYALLNDTIICTLSILVVLLSGLWTQSMPPSAYVAMVLSNYFPGIPYFMAILFFLAGFTTIIAFFVVGTKCAMFISPRWGKLVYWGYALGAFIFFSFYDQAKVLMIMSVSGGLLMLFNLSGILKLRKEIIFK